MQQRVHSSDSWTCNHDGQVRRVVVRSPRDNGPVLIGGKTIYPSCGIMGSSGILNKHGSTGYVEIGDTHKFDTSIDGDLAEYGCYATIFSKLIGQELFHGSSTDIYL